MQCPFDPRNIIATHWLRYPRQDQKASPNASSSVESMSADTTLVIAVPGIQRIGNVFYRVPESQMDSAVRFYAEVLGLSVKLRDGNRWVAFDVGGSTLALEGSPDGGTGTGGATVSLRADALDAVVADLHAKGARVGPIQTGPHERRAVVMDPAGNLLVLYEPA